MTKFASSLASAAALLAGLISTAHATVIPVVLTIPAPAGDGAPLIGQFTDTLSTSGAFTDSFVYAAPGPLSIDDFSINAGAGVQFTGVSLNWFNLPQAPLGLQISLSPSTIDASYNGELISGLYELNVSGNATAGSQFSGDITVFVMQPTAPVPEPATAAMMVAGLGATAAFLRRRRRAD